MSLILEALKKSEDKRRLGAAPDLATPFSAPRRRNWVWPIAALLLAVGLIAWALRPASPPQQTAADAAVKPSAPALHAIPTPGQKSGAPLRSVTGNNDLAPSTPPDNLPKPTPAPPPPSGRASQDKFVYGQPDPNAPQAPPTENRRAMFERRRAELGANRAPPTATAPVAKATPPKASAAAAPPPVAPAPAVVSTPPATVAAVTKAEVSAEPASTPTRAPKTPGTIGLTPAAAPTATAPAKAPPPAGASAQPYAELPFSVRKSLPELRLSMHVYMVDPSRRFVVLNDSRLTEGEKTNDEIFVREIRPDGVVLEFQNQRFFYPRDGL